MKIEDINYTLPTAEIAEKDFDKEKWIKEHPIDYFKLIYVLFKTSKKIINFYTKTSDIIFLYLEF